MIFNVLTIAGSDASGGAGIQADLKTFSALGVYGLSVITALTAQNTQGVSAVEPCSADFLSAQLKAVFNDIRIDAVKIGMLANAELVQVVATALKHYKPPYTILDTVMIAKGGHSLLTEEAVQALRDILLPLVDLITPNLPEAATLSEEAMATDDATMCYQGRLLLVKGCKAVLIKGGHLSGAMSTDWLLTQDSALAFSSPRILTNHIHGTGCTLSSAITALRVQRPNWSITIQDAKNFLQRALVSSYRLTVGKGPIGPLHHFHQWW